MQMNNLFENCNKVLNNYLIYPSNWYIGNLDKKARIIFLNQDHFNKLYSYDDSLLRGQNGRELCLKLMLGLTQMQWYLCKTISCLKTVIKYLITVWFILQFYPVTLGKANKTYFFLTRLLFTQFLSYNILNDRTE